MTGCVERSTWAYAIAFPQLSFGATTLAVLPGMIAGVPYGSVILTIQFLAYLYKFSVDRDKILFGFA